MFHDLVAGAGIGAMLNVSTFLQRIKELENSAEQKASRKANHEALVILEGFVDTVQSAEKESRVGHRMERDGAHHHHATRSEDQAWHRGAPYGREGGPLLLREVVSALEGGRP